MIQNHVQRTKLFKDTFRMVIQRVKLAFDSTKVSKKLLTPGHVDFSEVSSQTALCSLFDN